METIDPVKVKEQKVQELEIQHEETLEEFEDFMKTKLPEVMDLIIENNLKVPTYNFSKQTNDDRFDFLKEENDSTERFLKMFQLIKQEEWVK